MKTAISIPDPVFKSGEKLRKRLKLSRSALYARAIADMVRRYREDPVTRRLNEVYGPNGDGSELDPALERAALDVIRRSPWK